MNEKTRYFWGLINFDNVETDPTKMQWMPVRQLSYEDGYICYDIFGSDQGIRENEIVVFGPEIKMGDFEWGE